MKNFLPSSNLIQYIFLIRIVSDNTSLFTSSKLISFEYNTWYAYQMIGVN